MPKNIIPDKFLTVPQLAEQYNLRHEPGQRYPFKGAELIDAGGDITRQWVVVFYVWSVSKKQLQRRRKEVSGKTAPERRKKAKRYIHEIDQVLKSGAYIDPLADPAEALARDHSFPLVIALDKYMWLKKASLKAQSYATYEKWVRYFMQFLAARHLTHIGIGEFSIDHADQLRRFALDEQHMGNKTFNSYKGFVSGFIIHATPIYKLTSNPVAEILSNLPTITSKHRAYNPAQVQQYKALCVELNHPQLWLFCQLIYYTFCRPNEEARKMQVGDVRDDHIVIYGENSKTDHRTVMIPLALEIVFNQMKLRDYPAHFYVFSHEGTPGPARLGRGWMYERHIKVLQKMDLHKQGYDIYGWKHTGAIALYRATKDLMLVKEQCGHSDISQTVEYLRDLGVFHYSKEINKFPPI